MPRFTCESCGTSLYSAARPATLIDPSCPTCGASLEQRMFERRPDHDGGLGSIAATVPTTTRLELQR